MEYVFDIEANGLKPDNIHCLVFQMPDEYLLPNRGLTVFESTSLDSIRVGLSALKADDFLIGHNIVCYDMPVLEKLANVETKAKLVDTLALSWYLYPKRAKHGLADWGE